MRSAQPRTGILQKNCKEDEQFLESVRTLSRNKNGVDLPFMIFDARFAFQPLLFGCFQEIFAVISFISFQISFSHLISLYEEENSVL